MLIMYTGPRDVHQTPALERARNATQKLSSAEVIVDWCGKNDVHLENYVEYHFKKKRSVLTLFDWQIFLWLKIWSHKPNVIFNMSMLSVIPIMLYKLFFKVKVIYDCRDYLAVSYRWNPILRYLIQFIDNLSALTATKIVVPDEYGYGYFYMIRRRNIYIVHNTVKDYGIRKTATSGPVKLAYFGYLSEDRNFSAIIKYAMANKSKIELHLASNEIPLHLSVLIPSSENIIVHPALSHVDCQRLLSTMDYCLMTYNPELENYREIRPTKFYDCLALGLPYICSKGMVNLERHAKDGDNISVDYGSVNWGALKKTSFSNSNHALYSLYSYDAVVNGYRRFVESEVL